MAKQLKGMFV